MRDAGRLWISSLEFHIHPFGCLSQATTRSCTGMSGRFYFFQAAQCIPVGKEYDIPGANVVTHTPDQLGQSNHSPGGGGHRRRTATTLVYRTFLLPSSSVTVIHHMKSALLQVPHAFFSILVFAFAVSQLQCSCRHPDTHHTDSNGRRQRATKAQNTRNLSLPTLPTRTHSTSTHE